MCEHLEKNGVEVTESMAEYLKAVADEIEAWTEAMSRLPDEDLQEWWRRFSRPPGDD